MRNGGRIKVFENGNPQNKSIKEKAKIYGYDMSNPITAAVLSHGHRTGPDHTFKCMSVHKTFNQRHKKKAAA